MNEFKDPSTTFLHVLCNIEQQSTAQHSTAAHSSTRWVDIPDR